MILGQLPAAGDCEAIGAGLAGQPANTVTSLAFVVVGVALLVASRRANRSPAPAFSLAVVGIGVGSAIFHGPMPPWSRFVHDLPIAVVLVVAAARAGMRAGHWGPTGAAVSAVAGSVAAGGVLAAMPHAGVAVVVVAALGAAVAEAAAHRVRGEEERRRARYVYGAVALLVLPAGVLNVLGRTGGALCSPDSVVQFHAAWHLAAAAGLAVYGWGLVLRPPTTP